MTYVSIDSSKVDHMLDTLNTGAIPKEDIAAGYLHIAYDYAYAGSLSMRAAAAFDTKSAAKALQIGTNAGPSQRQRRFDIQLLQQKRRERGLRL